MKALLIGNVLVQPDKITDLEAITLAREIRAVKYAR